MPLYHYRCSHCGVDYDVVESIKDDPHKACKGCDVEAAERVLHPFILIDATPKTLGGMADKNEGPGRRYWLDKVRHEAGEDKPKERPFWRDSDTINTRLNDLTPQEKLNYMWTGNSAEPITPEITS